VYAGEWQECPIVKIISDAQRESGHGHGFSYTIAEKAVDAILSAVDEGTTFTDALEGDDDRLHEAIDSAVPVYNHDLAEMVQDLNSWECIEESMQEYGIGDNVSLASILSMAWYRAIENMARDIMEGLVNIETV
jgi:hypothetical protein